MTKPRKLKKRRMRREMTKRRREEKKIAREREKDAEYQMRKGRRDAQKFFEGL